MSETTAVPIRPLARGSVLKLWVVLILLLAAMAGIAWAGTRWQQPLTTKTGLVIQTLQKGHGPVVTPADMVQIDYVGRLPNGTEFDSSIRRGEPMVTGTDGIIPGLSEALQRMQEGGRYKISFPPQLGYGNQVPQGAPFGANDTLQFDVHVLRVATGLAEQQRRQQMQQLQQMMSGQGGGPQGGGAPPGAGVPPGAGAPPGAGPPPGAGAPGAGPPPGR